MLNGQDILTINQRNMMIGSVTAHIDKIMSKQASIKPSTYNILNSETGKPYQVKKDGTINIGYKTLSKMVVTEGLYITNIEEVIHKLVEYVNLH